MLTLTVYLLFDGTCADAMAFYHSCIGGDVSLTRVGDSPMKDSMPPAQHRKVINATLKGGGVSISASDWLHPTRTPIQGNTVCLYISGAAYGELRDVFDKLAVGADANLLDNLREMPFGTYGALTDRFGVRWMFQGARQQ